MRAVCALETTPAQRAFLTPNAASIAQAHFEPWSPFRAIYAGEAPVGFAMWRTEEPAVRFLRRFMIDARHQGNGYGRQAIGLLLALFHAEGAQYARLGYREGAGNPSPFYRALGETGRRREGGEQEMEKALGPG